MDYPVRGGGGAPCSAGNEVTDVFGNLPEAQQGILLYAHWACRRGRKLGIECEGNGI